MVPTGCSAALADLYAIEHNALGQSARDTVNALQRLERLASAPRPLAAADYPRDDFGEALRQTAQLVRAGVGLEAATIDLGGWDSHFTQQQLLEPVMDRLARGLAAFRRDLGPDMARTTVVVMTEFGRRVAENSALGTDHGRGSVMFALGGGVRGGRVLGGWPGLGPDALEGPGDLPGADELPKRPGSDSVDDGRAVCRCAGLPGLRSRAGSAARLASGDRFAPTGYFKRKSTTPTRIPND